jgi:hypothetical protein
MAAGFIAYFLALYALGYGHLTEFRVFNGIIQLGFLHIAIRAYYAQHPESIENYMLGVVQGMWASAVGVGIFAIFMTVFLLLDPALMEAILQGSTISEYLNAYSASLFILTEGLMVSLIGSYVLTRMAGFAVEKA